MNQWRIDHNAVEKPIRRTLEVEITDWLTVVKKPQLKPTTYDRLEYTIKCHIIENIGAYYLDEITDAVIQKELLDKVLLSNSYKGQFTDADKVLLTALRVKLMSDSKLQTMAKTSDPQIFAESIFPKAFGSAAQDCYMESQDTYSSLFADQSKYNAIMHALGNYLYREMRASV